MRILLILLWTVVTPCIAFGQANPYVGPLTFPDLYLFASGDIAPDGSYYLLAQKDVVHTLAANHILHVNRDLKHITSWVLNDSLEGQQQIIALRNGCLVITYMLPGYKPGAYVTRMDSLGQVRWTTYYYEAEYVIRAVAAIDESVYLGCMNSFVKIDNNGHLAWAKKSTLRSDIETLLIDLVACQDGGLTVSAVAVDGQQNRAVLARYDQTGQQLWQQTTNYAGRLLEVRNGDFIMQSAPASGMTMLRYSPAGQEISRARLLLDTSQAKGISIENLQEGLDGKLHMGGSILQPDQSEALCVAEMAPDFSTVWAAKCRPPGVLATNTFLYGRGHSCKLDATGRRHLFGRKILQVGQCQAYWYILPPNTEPLPCDAHLLSLQLQPQITPSPLGTIPSRFFDFTPTLPSLTFATIANTLCPPKGCNGYLFPSTKDILGLDQNFCQGEPFNVTLDASNEPGAYRWNTDDTSATITVSAPGIYSVSVAGGCGAFHDSVRVRVWADSTPTLLAALGPLPRCDGQRVQLIATGQPPLVWSDGFVGSRRWIDSSGAYWVRGTGVMNCHTLSSDTLSVHTNPTPTLSLQPSVDLCPGDSLLLGGLAEPYVYYAWESAGQTVSIASTYTIKNAQPEQGNKQTSFQNYFLRATSDSGCMATDSVLVLVHPFNEPWLSGTICRPVFPNVPNVITANGDLKNDAFQIHGLERLGVSNITIYNTYGEQVYTASPYQNTWSAEGLPAGVYFYRLQVPTAGWDVKGWVEVVR